MPTTMLKKTSLLSIFNSLQQSQCNNCSSQLVCGSNASPLSTSRNRRTSTQPQHSNQYSTCTNTTSRSIHSPRVTDPSWLTSRRSYATVNHPAGGIDFRDNMNWPCRKASNSVNPFIPSPYQIFDMHQRDTYTKYKYYELVKIYHPDRPSHICGCESLTTVERLERYRLIVQAHEILSDPVKRKAYDSYGVGWSEKRAATRHSRGYTSASTGKEYGQGPGYDNSPFGNATWEDWERWYRRQAPQAQQQAYAGTYVNPNAFAAFVILLAVLSGILQATRASSLSTSMGEKQLAFTEETSRFMSDRVSQLEGKELGKDGRVRQFLERRDPTRYGLKEDEEVQYKKHFGDQANMPPIGRTKLGRQDVHDDDESEHAHG